MKNNFFSIKDFRIMLQVYFVILLILYMYGFFSINSTTEKSREKIFPNQAAAPIFAYNFDIPGVLYEENNINKSQSEYWWLNSGGIMQIENGVGKTVQGELGFWNRWRIVYGLNNPIDTDNGSHPQNIFRLFTINTWENFSEEIYFKVNKDNLSDSPNRNMSNGVFLISRFKDRDNLYYTGVRVDGTAVIKKKVNGIYFTIAQKKIFEGETYNRNLNPSLLPKNTWIGIKSEIKSDPSGKVFIKFFTNLSGKGNWSLVFEEVDDGQTYGGNAILGTGSGGLRSDFMDIEFKLFKITGL